MSHFLEQVFLDEMLETDSYGTKLGITQNINKYLWAFLNRVEELFARMWLLLFILQLNSKQDCIASHFGCICLTCMTLLVLNKVGIWRMYKTQPCDCAGCRTEKRPAPPHKFSFRYSTDHIHIW